MQILASLMSDKTHKRKIDVGQNT